MELKCAATQHVMFTEDGSNFCKDVSTVPVAPYVHSTSLKVLSTCFQDNQNNVCNENRCFLDKNNKNNFSKGVKLHVGKCFILRGQN